MLRSNSDVINLVYKMFDSDNIGILILSYQSCLMLYSPSVSPSIFLQYFVLNSSIH